MDVKQQFGSAALIFRRLLEQFKSKIATPTHFTKKLDVNWQSIKIIVISSIALFIAIVLVLPTEHNVEFSQKSDERDDSQRVASQPEGTNNARGSNADALWGPPSDHRALDSLSDPNLNTPMVLGNSKGNARSQLSAGVRLPIRILDKVIVSDSAVPVLGEVLRDVESDSGLFIPAGSKIYGEASFAKGSPRAQIRFTQLSLPSGEMRATSGIAIARDGQPGLEGEIHSDGTKNTAGQILTTFVAGLATGSVQTDPYGNSRGGIANGLLTAVAGTAKDRAQNYGERLKAEREWIEVKPNSECDVLLNESLDLLNHRND
jgi:type IV secretory pathway VirB10-like protein